MLTEDQRIQGFSDGIKELSAKFKVVLVAEPIIQNGLLVARPAVFTEEAMSKMREDSLKSKE